MKHGIYLIKIYEKSFNKNIYYFFVFLNPFIITNDTSTSSSSSSGLERFENIHLWKKALRILRDFIPLLPPSSDIKMRLLDYDIKIVRGVVTFV